MRDEMRRRLVFTFTPRPRPLLLTVLDSKKTIVSLRCVSARSLYKREIVGPKLPGPVADSVRQLRKLLQEREPESKASEPVSADGDEISDILLDEEWARIVQLERENRRLG